MDAYALLGEALFEDCRFEESRAALDESIKIDPGMSFTHNLKGLVLERLGDDLGARRSFKTARNIDPAMFPDIDVPSDAEIERVVVDTLSSLPAKISKMLSNVPISVEDVPTIDDLKIMDPPLSPRILGLFRGQTWLNHETAANALLPSEIVMYSRNIARTVMDIKAAGDRRPAVEITNLEIKITLLHEIAHFFGFNEEEVMAIGLG